MEAATDNDGHQPDTKIERFERSLLVPLTDAEKRALADRQAFLLGELEDLIEERKNAAKQAQAGIDEKKAELARISGEYRAGKKFEKVKCERRLLFRLGNYQEVRIDTGEVLIERGLSDRERQLELNVNGAGVPDGDEERDREDDAPESGDQPLATQKKTRKKKGAKAS